MSDQFVAEVRIFPFNFAPTGWAFCDGQLLPISQNTALFSLLGTMYGGDGKSTFALPNIQGSCVVHPGQGQGLSEYFVGQQGGSETVTLLVSEMPFHTHQLMCGTDPGNLFGPDPGSPSILTRANGGSPYSTTTAPVVSALRRGRPPSHASQIVAQVALHRRRPLMAIVGSGQRR